MTLIDVETLKQQLALEGVSYDLDDSQLELLLNNIQKELVGYTNVPISATNHKRIIRNFNSDLCELEYYPVRNITSLKIGSRELTSDDYVLDEELGILYFNSYLCGMLVIEYCCQISDEMIDNVVNPLLFDIVKYRLTTNFSNDGVMSSMKEGDVSVNYDTSSSLGNLIQGRIKDLKNYYSIRIRMV